MNILNWVVDLANTIIERFSHVSIMDSILKYSGLAQSTLIVLTAFAGLWKYWTSKNREIDEKMLACVYSPLYKYIFMQEFFAYIASGPWRNYHDDPILEVERKTETFKMNIADGKVSSEHNKKEQVILTKEEFLNVLNSIDIGMAPKPLYELLSAYKVLLNLASESPLKTEQYERFFIVANDIENKLREEIITGYIKLEKKLFRTKRKECCLFSNSTEQIYFHFALNEKRRQWVNKKYYSDKS